MYDCSQNKWFEKLKFEHPDQEILEFFSPMLKVYVYVLEKCDDSMIAKGIPMKMKELKIRTQMYKDCILGSVIGDTWKSEPLSYQCLKQYRIHTK